MAFDWTKVPGYKEDMSAEEKLNLLASYEPDDKPPTGYVSKAQFDKAASELAAAKKELRDHMTDEQKKEADRAASQKAMEEELKTLRHEQAVSTHKAKFMSLGYDEQAAQNAALAMVDGNTDAVFAAMKKFGEDSEKNLRAELLKGTPTPPSGDDPNQGKHQSVVLAEQLAKAQVDSGKSVSDILSQYT